MDDTIWRNFRVSFFAEDPTKPALQLQIFERVETLHAHLERTDTATQSFKVRDRIIKWRQHRDPVAIGGQGFDQRAAEVPDVPGGVHRHQNVHVKYLMAA
jgi:hypothetical protein